MEIEYINPKLLKPDPNQPRTRMDEEKIKSLAQSYETFPEKLIDPIEIDRNNMIVRGHRRREASIIAGLEKVPVHRIETVDTDKKSRLERQLIEAVEYSPMDRAWAYATAIININQSEKQYTIPEVKQLGRNHLLTLVDASTGGPNGTRIQGQSELSRRIGVPQQTISMYLKNIFCLEPNTQQLVDEGELPITLATELSKVNNPRTKSVIESVVRELKPQRDVIRKTVDLLREKENVKKEVVKKVFSMETRDALRYLESLNNVHPEVQEEIISSDLTAEEIDRVAEFVEPEQQREVLDRYERQVEENGESLGEVVDRMREIADGNLPPNLSFEEDPDEVKRKKVDDLYGHIVYVTKISLDCMVNEKEKQLLIKRLKDIENHIHKLLIDINEYEVIE